MYVVFRLPKHVDVHVQKSGINLYSSLEVQIKHLIWTSYITCLIPTIDGKCDNLYFLLSSSKNHIHTKKNPTQSYLTMTISFYCQHYILWCKYTCLLSTHTCRYRSWYLLDLIDFNDPWHISSNHILIEIDNMSRNCGDSKSPQEINDVQQSKAHWHYLYIF